MARLKFGAFLAPHHPIGENPLLQFRRDLDFVEQIDTLGFDEFWCGEHHSSGWEMIASPEMFLAAAGERTELDALGAFAGGGQKHFRRGDGFPAGRMVLAAPELVIAERVDLLDEVEVAAELEQRILADRVMRGEKGSEFQACHGGFSPDLLLLRRLGPNYGVGKGKAILEARRQCMVVAQSCVTYRRPELSAFIPYQRPYSIG